MAVCDTSPPVGVTDMQCRANCRVASTVCPGPLLSAGEPERCSLEVRPGVVVLCCFLDLARRMIYRYHNQIRPICFMPRRT